MRPFPEVLPIQLDSLWASTAIITQVEIEKQKQGGLMGESRGRQRHIWETFASRQKSGNLARKTRHKVCQRAELPEVGRNEDTQRTIIGTGW